MVLLAHAKKTLAHARKTAERHHDTVSFERFEGK
jgi:hypothetical protein